LAIVTGSERKEWLGDVTIIAAESNAHSANTAAKKSKADLLIFLSDEIASAEDGWMEELISHVARPEIGAVGARLWSPEGKLEDGGLILGINGVAGPAFRGIPRGHPGYFNRAWLQQNFSAVSGACLAVRRELFLKLDGFDERNLPRSFYDIDFCLRVREVGLQVIWTPYANLIFAGSGIRLPEKSPEEARYMQGRWSYQFSCDPFYNPNLSLEAPGFSIAFPPRL
jgi:GT2 family glycosyltransferase